MSGSMVIHPRVGYGVLFLEGGESLDLGGYLAALGDEYEFDDVPSFATFLRSGKFIRRYEPSQADIDAGEVPFVARRECGDEVLGEMTDEVLRLVRLRTPALTAIWDLSAYRGKFIPEPYSEQQELELNRLPFGRRPFFEPLSPNPEE